MRTLAMLLALAAWAASPARAQSTDTSSQSSQSTTTDQGTNTTTAPQSSTTTVTSPDGTSTTVTTPPGSSTEIKPPAPAPAPTAQTGAGGDLAVTREVTTYRAGPRDTGLEVSLLGGALGYPK